jgi:chorismate mutase/prephenate dehydrogenase
VAERDSLREQITALDSSILALVARRMEVAREIGLTKAKDGADVRDASREEAVVKDFTRRAGALGLDEANATTIARALIQEAVRVQLEKGARYLEGRKVLIIGSGRMGAWTARFASNRGASVCVHDPRGTLDGYDNVPSLDDGIADADFVVLASPLGTAREDLRALLSARPSGVIFDVCSVKSHLKDMLRDAITEGFKITSVHPMFGPGAITPAGRNVLVCSCGSPDADAAARKLFEDAGAVVTDLAIDDHDRVIARALGAPHLCALVFGRAVSRSGLSQKELAAVEGPSFVTLRRLVAGISAESRRVYHDIQRLNPHTREAMEEIEQAIRELKEASLDDDPAGFARIMDDERDYFGGWS